MAIKRNHNDTYIRDVINEFVEKSLNKAIRHFMRVGEEALTYARTLDTYKDDTGNLRSSIGYAVVHDGKTVMISDFEQVLDGRDGSDKGATILENIVKTKKSGLWLVMVAGMNYASAVESKGYDVTTGASLLARQLVDEMFNKSNR